MSEPFRVSLTVMRSFVLVCALLLSSVVGTGEAETGEAGLVLGWD